jgi:hypothetical protein
MNTKDNCTIHMDAGTQDTSLLSLVVGSQACDRLVGGSSCRHICFQR